MEVQAKAVMRKVSICARLGSTNSYLVQRKRLYEVFNSPFVSFMWRMLDHFDYWL
jgi:hypothetical protein